jgi:hypothetical protein
MKAYPQNESTLHIDLPIETQQGMDLRDYFAAKAMPLAFKIWENYHCSEENDSTYKTSNFQADGIYITLITKTAYEMADEMMKVRK